MNLQSVYQQKLLTLKHPTMRLKSPIRREAREKKWIHEELNNRIVLFAKECSPIIDKIVKEKTPIFFFFFYIDHVESIMYEYDVRWNAYVNGLKLDPKKHVIPYHDLMLNRCKFIIAQFILIDIYKMPSHRVGIYLKEGILKEDLYQTLSEILCVELARKDYVIWESTKMPKKIYFLQILKQVYYSVSSLVSQLKFRKN